MSHSNSSDFDTVDLIWLDATVYSSIENHATQKELRSITHNFHSFDSIHDCEKYIQTKTIYDRLFLIVSGQLGRDIVPRIHHYRQIFSIYVYCQNKQKNEEWANKFSKVRIKVRISSIDLLSAISEKIKGVIIKLDQLIKQIQTDFFQRIQSKVDEPLSMSISLSNTSFPEHFLHSQLLIDCLFHSQTLPSDKQQLIQMCKMFYENNAKELSIIQDFEQKYISNESIWWLTRDSCFSRLLTKALCANNLDLLFLLGFFIRDINEHLTKNRLKSSSIQVYHGQLMSIDELHLFKNSLGHYLLIQTFLLANQNRKSILSSLNTYPNTNDTVRILFDITTNSDKNIFADITPFAYLAQEQQILFTLGSIFQIKKVHHEKKSELWIVELHLSSINKPYESTKSIVFNQLKQSEHAEKVLARLVQELPSNDIDLPSIYHSLALLTFQRTNYKLSLEWYEKLVQYLHPTDINLPNTYYSIGCIHQQICNYPLALDYYQKALKIWHQLFSLDNEPIEMAECLNNMGCIYEIEKYYSKALDCHQKALAIRDRYANDLGSTYNNIGNVYLSLGVYDAALENYKTSLDLKTKSLPTNHLSIAQTLRNIGLVYEQDENSADAIEYYRRAEQIYADVRLSTSEIQDDIKRILANSCESNS